MTVSVEVLSSPSYAGDAAARIALDLPGEGSVVLTGGTTAAEVYAPLSEASVGWGGLEVFFSDERCVPPDHEASNFKMASSLLLERVEPQRTHRMRGEMDPEPAARAYGSKAAGAVRDGFDLLLLGLGADCHIAALFPESPALAEQKRLCLPVDRPDGMKGLTLTPPALISAKRVILLVTGEAKAGAVRRAVAGAEPVESCPERLLADLPDVTFLLDEAAASLL